MAEVGLPTPYDCNPSEISGVGAELPVCTCFSISDKKKRQNEEECKRVTRYQHSSTNYGTMTLQTTLVTTGRDTAAN